MRNGLKAISILLLVLSLGLQWALLQTVAWTGMLIAYSRDASLRDAVVKTFDGEHPCPICHIVKTGRAEQKQSDQVKLATKLDPGLVWNGIAFIISLVPPQVSASDQLAEVRCYSPPKPRPRCGIPPLPPIG
ncbi:MAG: hypothetical protein KJ072_15180 [Verrucomicrobia bacterium]|nr:hypothetical protein [Verrucomicrobiota bacterium]